MRRQTVTMRDVATRAQVSVSTVSQVLNGNAHYVGRVKRERVLAAIKELNYRPNAIARSMVKRRTTTIGLVITAIDNSLFSLVAGAVEKVLREQGYHILLASAPDPASEREAIEMLRARQVDGFIFMFLSLDYPNDHLLRLQEDEIPFIVINRHLEMQSINSILFDDRGAGYYATQHLLNLGHTRIATISGPLRHTPLWRSVHERHQGWQQALADHHLVAPPAWIVDGRYTHEGGYQAALQLLDAVEQTQDIGQRPTALFIANDEMAIGVLRALHHRHIRIPQDMALITIGNPSYTAYTMPALTTLEHPIPAAGALAARFLLDWLNAGKPAEPQHITLGFKLCIRESCGARQVFPADNVAYP